MAKNLNLLRITNILRKMTHCYFRKYECGLGSNIVFICSILNGLKETRPVYFELNCENYGCSWNDVFDQEDPSTITGYTDFQEIFWKYLIHNSRGYDYYLIREYHDVYNRYIHPKQFVFDKIDEISSKYDIPNVTCIYFRGSDKKIECERVEPEAYDPYIPSDGPLWIQSDELQFIQRMESKYGSRAFHIEEFNFSDDSNKPLHMNANKDIMVETLVIMYLMARCKFVIGNISNMTYSAMIIKGDTQGFFTV